MKAETGLRSEICPRIKVSLTRRPVFRANRRVRHTNPSMRRL